MRAHPFLWTLLLILSIPSANAKTSMVEAHAHALAVGKLDTFVRFYRANVHRGTDLLPLFENASRRDQRQVRAYLADVQTMPELVRENESLTFRFGADQVHVEIPDLRQNQFILAGTKFAYDPSAAPAWQMRLF